MAVIVDQTTTGTSLQNAINALPSTGGRIYIGAINGTIDTTINIANKSVVEIWGMGHSTVLTAKNALNNHLFTIDWSTVDKVVFRDMLLDGNKASQTSGVGTSDGITYSVGTIGSDLRVENVLIQNTKGSGIDYKGDRLLCRNVEVDSPAEHGIVTRSGSTNIDIDGAYLHGSSNHGLVFEGSSSDEVTGVALNNIRADNNTKNGISGSRVKDLKATNIFGDSNTWSLFDIERLMYYSISNVVGNSNGLRCLVLEAYDGSNHPTTWEPSRFGMIDGVIGRDNGWGLVALQEVLDSSFSNFVGHNCSAVQSNIGALVELRYNPAHTYNAARRNLRLNLTNMTYYDTRGLSQSTYGVAMNGSNGSSAGGDFISISHPKIVGTLTSDIRFINDGTTSSNSIIDDR